MNSYGWVDANGQPYLVDPTRAKINAVLLAVEAHVLDNQIAALEREYAQLKKQYNARVPGVMGAIRAGVKARMVPRLQKLAVSLRKLHGKRAEIAREFAEGGFQGLEFATFAKTDEFKPFAWGRGWKGAYDVAKWILRRSPTRDAGVEPSYDDVNGFLLFGGLLRAKLASLARSAVCDDAVGTATQASEYGAGFFDDMALQATRNSDSSKLVLGKWLQDGKSYTSVAEHYKATYFKLKNWRQLSKMLTPDQLWEVNEAFLDQQIKAGKQIILSHDPLKATGFFLREVEYLEDIGYRFVQDGWVWKAIR